MLTKEELIKYQRQISVSEIGVLSKTINFCNPFGTWLYKEGVVGVGEIGFDDQTAAEEKYYRLQLELSKEAGLPVQVHTPHRDKKKGTELSMAIALEHGIDPSMVIIDHNNEETVKSVLDQGFYANI